LGKAADQQKLPASDGSSTLIDDFYALGWLWEPHFQSSGLHHE
jgi:hypothetical protein